MRMCDPRGATTLCNYVNLVNPSDRHILECGGGDRHVHVQKVRRSIMPFVSVTPFLVSSF